MAVEDTGQAGSGSLQNRFRALPSNHPLELLARIQKYLAGSSVVSAAAATTAAISGASDTPAATAACRHSGRNGARTAIAGSPSGA
jgi:hypothetical protein